MAVAPAHNTWKTIADLLPAIGFFGVFFIAGRDMLPASWGLVAGIGLQLFIYKIQGIPIPKWMLGLSVFAVALAGLTLYFQDPYFIKLRPTFVGLLIAAVVIGSVLIRKNIFKALLGKVLAFPDRTWNMIAILWSVPIIINALLNLVMANILTWPNFNFEDDTWVYYRMVGGFVVTGVSLGLAVGYVILTKQHKNLSFGEDANQTNEQDQTPSA